MWFLSFFYQLQRYKTVTVRPSYVIFKLFMEAQIKQIYIIYCHDNDIHI